jgi:hypothetical protein
MMRLFLAAFVLAAVVPARAHHPFTPYYDATKPVSVTGVVVELRAVNPHAVLIVNGTTTDGRSGLWAFEGLPPNALLRRGPTDFRETLRAGTQLTISGWAAKDPAARAFSAGEVTFADGSKMLFGIAAPGGGADNWKCSSDPCPDFYRYPQVPSN